MNNAHRPRPRPLTPFIVADEAPATPAPVQDASPPPPPLPKRAEAALARPALPRPCRPGELVWASPA